MEEFSGSLGLTGSTDCNMVLQRQHDSPLAKLYITGNYVMNQELNLHFDEARTTWERTSDKTQKSVTPERQAILDVLRQEERPMTPMEIARRLEKERSTVRASLYHMKKDEQLVSFGQGMYMLAASAQQQALLEEEAE